MTTATLPVTIELDATLATNRWLNAYLAHSEDENRYVLYRTLCVEFFETGAQFIACDGTMLFRTWTPRNNAIDGTWPTHDQRPDLSVVVMDAEKFASGFMNTLRSAIGEFSFPVTLSVDQEESDQAALSDEMTPNVLTIAAMNQQLHCRLIDQPYPDWRSLKFGVERSELVEGMKIARRMFTTVGKMRGVDHVDMDFTARRVASISSALAFTKSAAC